MMVGFFIGLAVGTSAGFMFATVWASRASHDMVATVELARTFADDSFTAGRNFERRARGQEPLALPSALRSVGL